MNHTIQIKLIGEHYQGHPGHPGHPGLHKSLQINITDLDSNLLCESVLAHKIVFSIKN